MAEKQHKEYLLTATASNPPKDEDDNGYDVDTMNRQLDFVHLLTFEFYTDFISVSIETLLFVSLENSFYSDKKY